MIWNNWVLAFIPVAWFVQNCIHESSHLLMGWWVEGRKPLGFWPYPHRYKGRWYFARYQSGKPKYVDIFIGHRHIAPFFYAWIWMLIGILVMNFMPGELKIFCLPFIIAGLGDALFFWYTYFWGSVPSDGKRYRLVNLLRKERVRKNRKGEDNAN